MGTYGEPIVAAVPAVSSLGTQYATDVNAVLDEIVTRVEAKVPFSALSGGTFDLNGEDIEDVNYISFSSNTGTPSVAPSGRLVYSDGELWFINTLGAIQLTSGTGLNAAAIGGITGDYGSPNPAELRFVDTSQTYAFYDNYGGGAWARTKALSLDVAAGATSAFYSRITFGGAATSNVILFEDKPVSGRSVVVFDTAGQLFHNTGTNTVENDIYFAAGKWCKTPSRKMLFIPSTFRDRLDTGTWTEYIPASVLSGVTLGTTSAAHIALHGLVVGMELTSVTVRTYKTVAANCSWILTRIADGTNTTVKASAGVGGTGWVDVADTFTHTVTDGGVYILQLVGSVGGDTTFTSISVGYTG